MVLPYSTTKLADISDLDTQRSFFVESGRHTTRYLRILRVCFVKAFAGDELLPHRPVFLNYATFQPMLISSGGIIGIPLFETMAENMKRAMSWLNKTSPGTLLQSRGPVCVCVCVCV